MRTGFDKKMKLPGMNPKDLKIFKEADYVTLTKAAIDHSDGITINSEKIHPEIEEYLKTCGKPVLPFQGMEQHPKACNDFYETLLNKQ